MRRKIRGSFANPCRPGAGHRPPYPAGRDAEQHELDALVHRHGPNWLTAAWSTGTVTAGIALPSRCWETSFNAKRRRTPGAERHEQGLCPGAGPDNP